MALYMGLMSGTSMDAIDVALVDLDATEVTIVAARNHPMPLDVRSELLELAGGRGDDLERVSRLDVVLGRLFADAALRLLGEGEVNAEAVRAIGSHGQTIRHLPTGTTPRTVQIGDPNVIAERTGITTVADFRRRDLAAGGQGAPLVPAFHRAVLHRSGVGRVVVNIGGIANITVLPPDRAAPVTGFDTGPGNVLLDAWAAQHLDAPMDVDARWAAGGREDGPLLAALLREPYFGAAPPKSSGREHFNLAWLQGGLDALERQPAPRDVERTLCALTVTTIAEAVERHAPAATEVLVCGGGARNPVLMEGLAARLAGRRVASTASAGLDPDWVEAAAFAWLAREALEGRPGNLPEVTGAHHPVVLGGIYRGQVR